MSASMPGRPATFSSSGYQDGLGRRTLVFDRAEGATCERLVLRAELGVFEAHLRERVERLKRVESDRLAHPRRIVRDGPAGLLHVETPLPPGQRLSDLLAAAEGDPDIAAGGVDLAIGFLLDVFPILDGLHRQAGFAHGALAPGRLLLTPEGQVVLLDAIYADVLARLGWSRARFWREMGLAVPDAHEPLHFAPATDVLHAVLVALVLMLGRPLRENEYPGGLAATQAEAVEIAEIRGGGEFAVEFGGFLDRALDPSSPEGFIGARQAAHALYEIAENAMGAGACRDALRGIAETTAAAGYVPVPAPTPRPAAAAAAPRPRASQPLPPPMVLRIEIPSIPAAPPVPEPAPEPVREPVPEPAVEHVVAAALPVPVEAVPVEAPRPESPAAAPVQPEPAADLPPAATPVEPALEVPPFAAPAPAPSEPEPVRAAAEVKPPSQEVSAVSSAPPAEPPPALPPPLPAAAAPVEPPAPPPPPAPVVESARNKKRGRKGRADALRSKSAAKAAKQAEKAPLVSVPAVVPPLAPPAPPQPMFPAAYEGPSAPSSYGTPSVAPAYGTASVQSPYGSPAPPAPVRPAPPAAPAFEAGAGGSGAVYGGGSYSLPMPQGDPGQIPMATIALKPGAGIQVKKSEPAQRPVTRTAPAEPREIPAPRFELREAQPSGGVNLKVIAAVIVLVAIGLAGARQYLWHATPEAVAPAPEETPVASTSSRGSLILTSAPPGARVLIDGQPVGQTPLTLDDVIPGRRVVTFVAEQGTVRRTVRVEAGRSAEVDVTVFSGWVTVDAPILLEVVLDGRVVGTTEQPRLMLPPGRHTLALRNQSLGYRTTQIVNIEPGEEFRVNLSPTTPINLNATPWAEVWIDGKRIGETPIANVPVLLGTREITFRHPELGERRLTPTIKAGNPSAISVDLARPDR
jgi:hypothetical protein